jgi:hypothetical protein
MVTVPADVGAVYVTWQLLCEELIGAKVQVPLLKLPPLRLAFHDTVPPGALVLPAVVSVTVTV